MLEVNTGKYTAKLKQQQTKENNKNTLKDLIISITKKTINRH